jgi:4-amino-4-deoxy-L-arabinose transferase-like glycosyltransferase
MRSGPSADSLLKFARAWPVLFLLAALCLLQFFSRRHLTPTYDEPAHLVYGLRVASGNSDRFDNSKMPVSAFNALPLRLSGMGEQELLASDPAVSIGRARQMTTWGAVLLGLVVFCWAAELYGYVAGLFALGLDVLEPNLTAHSQLVTTDLYGVLFITLALYTYWRFLCRPGGGRLAVSALALALAQVAKYSAAYLYPVYLVIAAVWRWRRSEPPRGWWTYAGAILVYATISVAVINAAFLFNRTLMPWGDYAFKSRLFQSLQRHTPALAHVPVPLPYPYVQGLDHVKYGDESGPGLAFGEVYLLGESRSDRGFFDYYLVAFVFKTPLGLQILGLWAVVRYARHRRRHQFARDELFLAAPALFFAVYFSFFFKAQIGLRYFLVVYPLLIVFVGSLLQDWPNVTRRARVACAALGCWIAVSNLSYFGHYLSYFNELVGERKNSYQILADSNLDWGQNVGYLTEYLQSHPATVYNPPDPRPGHFIIDANLLVGVIPHVQASWLRRFEPSGHLVYSYLIFDISPSDLTNRAAPPR